MILVLVLTIAVTLVAHETGHALAAQLYGLPWKPTLTRHGPGVVIGSETIRLSPAQVRVTAAAGPAANLLLVAVGLRLGVPFMVLASLEFAVMNLLPFRRSDGARILYAGRVA